MSPEDIKVGHAYRCIPRGRLENGERVVVQIRPHASYVYYQVRRDGKIKPSKYGASLKYFAEGAIEDLGRAALTTGERADG